MHRSCTSFSRLVECQPSLATRDRVSYRCSLAQQLNTRIMVMSALYIMDSKGKVIVTRNYRGDIPISVAEKFSLHVQENDEMDLRPVFTEDGITYVYIKCNNVLLLAVTKRNSNITLILLFLYRLAGVFKDYFGELEEESIRDNFVVVYELLDETMDFGYPQTCESKILREVVTQESNRLEVAPRPPVALTNAVSWRQEGVKHRKNEIFLDVVEKVNILVASNGTVLQCDILGAIVMKSFLSGMPELKLGLNDKLMFEATGRANTRIKAVELEDIKFHQCVRLARFENDRTISFIPPDGDFELMSYRLNTQVKPLIWVESSIETHKSRIEFSIKAKTQFKNRSIANNVEIIIPVPHDVDSPTFKASIGNVVYFPDRDAVVWTIKQFAGGKEFQMRAHFGLPSISAEDGADKWKGPIEVKFEIPYFTVSGLQVRYLKIIEKSGYQALPWVRYITVNGSYQLRMI